MTPEEIAEQIIDQHGEIGLREAIATALREAEARGLERAEKIVLKDYQSLCQEHRLLLVKRAAAIRAEKERTP